MINKITSIINRIKENNGGDTIGIITMESSLRSDIGFDSLDLAELTVRIENEFGVDVFEDGIVNTVGEIIERLEK